MSNKHSVNDNGSRSFRALPTISCHVYATTEVTSL